MPDEDWLCPICVQHMVEGVCDCPSAEPGSCRIGSLGTDRHGARYWFAGRRLWVQTRDEVVKYYSTRAQLAEILEVLDSEVYETEVYAAILAEREEIEAQMDITEKLTKELNKSGKKAWLEMDNLVLDKLQKERNDLKVTIFLHNRMIILASSFLSSPGGIILFVVFTYLQGQIGIGLEVTIR